MKITGGEPSPSQCRCMVCSVAATAPPCGNERFSSSDARAWWGGGGQRTHWGVPGCHMYRHHFTRLRLEIAAHRHRLFQPHDTDRSFDKPCHMEDDLPIAMSRWDERAGNNTPAHVVCAAQQ
jgi:hypothetical protein